MLNSAGHKAPDPGAVPAVKAQFHADTVAEFWDLYTIFDRGLTG